MSSSKFNSSQFKKSLLPWCAPPPDPPLGPPIGGPSPTMTAYATWVDHDPADYAHVSESFDLHPIALGEHYSGISGPDFPKVELDVKRVDKTNDWVITITVHRTAVSSEDYGFPAITANPVDPVQLHPPLNVVIAGADYRAAHVYG